MDVRVIMIVGGLNPNLEGFRFDGVTVKVAKCYSSEPPPADNISFCVNTYEKVIEGEKVCGKIKFDGNGQRYKLIEKNYNTSFSNMYEYIEYRLNEDNNIEKYCFHPINEREYDIICYEGPRGIEFPSYIEDIHCYTYLEWKGDSPDWEKKAKAITNTFRLFKVSSIRFGKILVLYDGGGIGENNLYENTVSVDVANHLNDFSMNDNEKECFLSLYNFVSEKTDDKIINFLIELNRTSYTLPDYDSSFMLQTIIWETFIHEIKNDNESQIDKKYINDYGDLKISKTIRNFVSFFIATNGEDRKGFRDLINYLYDQRSSITHGEHETNEKSFVYGFDISRCLICKLLAIDKDIKTVGQNIFSEKQLLCDYDYSLMKIDKTTYDKIKEFKKKKEEKFEKINKKIDSKIKPQS